MSPRAPETAVVASSALPWIFNGPSDGLISLGLGLLGVLLARTIFVNRENRALGRRQPWRETLPITLAACLIAGGMIWDGHLLYSKAIFTGIAVGWTTIVVIDKISRFVNPGASASPTQASGGPDPAVRRGIRRALKQTYQPPLAEPTAEETDILRRLDRD